MLTPENTIRQTPDEEGFKYLCYLDGTWFAFETGEEVTNATKVGGRYPRVAIPLGAWDDDNYVFERGPAEFKDLPIVYNDFVSLPEFECEN